MAARFHLHIIKRDQSIKAGGLLPNQYCGDVGSEGSFPAPNLPRALLLMIDGNTSGVGGTTQILKGGSMNLARVRYSS